MEPDRLHRTLHSTQRTRSRPHRCLIRRRYP